MGMMGNLRNKTHLILWFLLILFVLSMTIGGLVGGANIMDIISGKSKLEGTAGIVNKQTLKGDQYYRLVQNEIDRLRENGQEVTDATIDRVSDQIWDAFVNEALLNEEIERLNLHATDEEIYEILVNRPPQFLREQEAFQTDGTFDYQKYLEFLSHPAGNEQFWFYVEQLLRYNLPFEKISNLVQNMAVVSEEEVLFEYLTTKINYNLETLLIPFSIVEADSFIVTEDEIASYYTRHKEDFFVEETRALDYLFFELKPSREDTLAVYNLAKELKERIEEGESFETVAIEYTEDPSGKKNGGELGWFSRGQMVSPFEEAAFSAKVGTVTGPVLTRFGYHIIKVEDKRKQNGQEQVKARHILLRITPGPGTAENIRSKANLFAFDANELGFDVAADTYDVQIKKTGPLRRDSEFIPGLGYFPQAVDFAFSDKPIGSISEVYNSENGYAIFRLAEINEEYYQPLPEVRDRIVAVLQKNKKIERLGEIAEDIYNSLGEYPTFESVPKEYPGLKYDRHESVTLNEPLKSIGKSDRLIGAILALESGQFSVPVRVGDNFVIVKLLSKDEFSEKDYAVEKELIRDKLLSQKKRIFYNNWLVALKDNAEIIDNRENL